MLISNTIIAIFVLTSDNCTKARDSLLTQAYMVSLRFRLGGVRAEAFSPTTRLRYNSTRPPFDHTSNFRLVDAPSPSWRIGDGLPSEINHWKEVVSANRKTWDFTNLENIR